MRLVQQILVEDRIAGLRRDAAAIRAERARSAHDVVRGTASGSRQRFGRWLVGVGQAIAGGPSEPDCGPGNPVTGAV